MIPMHTAPGTRSSLFSPSNPNRPSLTFPSLSSLLTSFRFFLLSLPSLFLSNPVLYSTLLFTLLGTWYNRRNSWSHTLKCSSNSPTNPNGFLNSCSLKASTKWGTSETVIWGGYEGVIKCQAVRVDPVGGRFYKNVEGLTRKERR
mmetsp:Transcript_23081/g.43375  ORF Transcript_23081/g.43375 Transcript_23081/m.43375 type:complete len:145 (+) Transcript_23081:109-543(+)